MNSTTRPSLIIAPTPTTQNKSAAPSDKKAQKLLVVLHCSYDNNYQEIYEPMYDHNIIFYDEESFEFQDYIQNDSNNFYDA